MMQGILCTPHGVILCIPDGVILCTPEDVMLCTPHSKEDILGYGTPREKLAKGRNAR